MLEQKLEQELKKFLDKNKRNYYSDSIKYSTLRDMNRRDGTSRKLHVVNFTVSISDQPYDGDGFFFATFDEKNHHLVEIVGPQPYENFEQL